ncbi:AAA domain-containing protein [Demequina globuliformis]|uniref:AAA domain-containing protein n=1 Tax=Demequina globuliformis TaxID=676202 RepID=UPI0007812AD7|nr:AAA domain-containing protein [Demequina globuliformis]
MSGHNNLVLILDTKSQRWKDRTRDVRNVQPTDQGFAVTFSNGKRYQYGPERVVFSEATEDISIAPDQRVTIAGAVAGGATRVQYFGDHTTGWGRVQYTNGFWSVARAAQDIEILASGVTREATPVWEALKAYSEGLPEDDPTRRGFERMRFVHPGSALARYLNAGDPTDPTSDPEAAEPIFPFQANLSQRTAVPLALTQPITVIDGPPGTGKTETILNIIANVVADPGGKVAVATLANAAVDNIYEKLTKEGLGFVAAPLGNRERVEAFVQGQRLRANELTTYVQGLSPAIIDPTRLAAARSAVTTVYRTQWRLAQARAELRVTRAEQSLFLERREAALTDAVELPRKVTKASADALVTLLAELEVRDTGLSRWRSWRQRRRLRRTFGLRPHVLDADIRAQVQQEFYTARIDELTYEIDQAEALLGSAELEAAVRDVRHMSSDVLDAGIVARYGGRSDADAPTFDADTMWQDTDRLAREYPAILSSCHSLPKYVNANELLDVLILDEASQISLPVAVLALAMARRVVIVGDTNQLGHILSDSASNATPPDGPYDFERHSILSSVIELYGDTLPRVMLREHYRCDPRIIEFCNRQYYGGALLAMTGEGDGPAMSLVRTAPGYHARRAPTGGGVNQRELDVVAQEVVPHVLADFPLDDIGLVTPYRAQANLAVTACPGLEADTVHKYQGRAKKAMVMSAVVSGPDPADAVVAFVDDSRMINVAVSRAQQHFALVVNPDLPADYANLTALSEYIAMQSPGDVYRSKVVSVFDVLYSTYSQRLLEVSRRITGRLQYRSEEAMLLVLERTLEGPGFEGIGVATQVHLINLLPHLDLLDDAAAGYVRRGASLDFVLYSEVTGRALGAIEVDGHAFHAANPEQLEKDALKDRILETYGVPLERFATTGSGEDQRVQSFVKSVTRAWTSNSRHSPVR